MDDRDLILKLAELDCLYARAGRPASEVLLEARDIAGERTWLVIAALSGQVSGHEWCACSECGSIRLMEPTGLKRTNAKEYTDEPPPAHPYCKMTPRCLGHMVRLAKRPVLREGTKKALRL